MGQILFLIYVNDISSNISSTLRMFPDDTKVYRELSNIAKDNRGLGKYPILATSTSVNNCYLSFYLGRHQRVNLQFSFSRCFHNFEFIILNKYVMLCYVVLCYVMLFTKTCIERVKCFSENPWVMNKTLSRFKLEVISLKLF